MSKSIRGNNRHLTLEDRIYIEKCLEQQMAFKDIAKFLCKDPTSISKEVKKHRILKPKNSFNSSNDCKHRRTCNRKNVCNRPVPCKRQCSSCKHCNSYCPDYQKDICQKLNRTCFVCNGCRDNKHCRREKYYYRASMAYKTYKNTLVESRMGINITESELHSVDCLVSPLIAKRQSIAHIYSTHKADIPFSSRTLYSHIDNNLLSVRNIDLPRKVRYKPRRKTKRIKRDHSWLEARRYTDFQSFIEKYPGTNIVEMDVVEGVKGGKVLLTMLFRSSNCMLAFLLKDKTQEAVVDVFDNLERDLGNDLFKKTFQVILTDNGSEFINPILLENGIHGAIRTSIYYCDPNASFQKGALEKNHEFIRYIVPKGKAFDKFSQADITLMINHINSLARARLNNRTPFEVASLLIDKRVLMAVKLEQVKHDDVLLKPSLLQK